MHHGVGHHYFAFIASVFISLEVVFNAMGQTLGVIVAWLPWFIIPASMLLTCRCAYGINLLNGGRPHWGKLSPTSRLCQDGMNTIWVSGALYVHKGLATPISVVLVCCGATSVLWAGIL